MRKQNARERVRPAGAVKPGLVALAGLAVGHGMAAPASAQPCDPADLFGDGMSFELAPPGSNQALALDVKAADFNGDGAPDLVYPVLQSIIMGDRASVLLNNGDGTFGTPQQYEVSDLPISPQPTSVVTGDFDDDGDIDIGVAGNGAGSGLSVLTNDGDGSFTFTDEFGAFTNGTSSSITADFDGDGDLDVALGTGGNGPHLIYLLYNDGDGNFTSQQQFSGGQLNVGFATGDFDGDGSVDIATTATQDQEVAVLLNDGDGGLTAEERFATNIGGNTRDVAAADFDGDGDIDLAATAFGGAPANDLCVLLNDGSGNFTAQAPLTAGSNAEKLTAADLDGDGDADLAVANASGEQVSVLLNNGDGTFAPQEQFPVSPGPYDVVASDLNSDGRLDLATANVNDLFAGEGDGSVVLNECIGEDCPPDLDGDGEVTSSDFLEYIDLFAAGDPAADFNDDGSITSSDFLAYIDAFAKGCP